MKKFMSVLLTAILVLCLAGCGGEKKDVKTILNDAMQKAQESADMDLTIDMDMDMTAAGESMAMEMQMDVKVQDNNKETMKMEMPMSLNMPGQGVSMDMNLYYADGYYYMDMMGMKIKTPMDLAEIQKSLEGSTGMVNIGIEGMKELEMEEKDGTYIINFVGDTEKMADYMDSVMTTMESMYGIEDSDVKLEEMKGTITVNKEGYITEQNVEMTMTMVVEGEETECSLVMNAVYNNPGEAVTVELPDLSEYEEMQLTE